MKGKTCSRIMQNIMYNDFRLDDSVALILRCLESIHLHPNPGKANAIVSFSFSMKYIITKGYFDVPPFKILSAVW